jgi:hypothetical protein
LSAVPDGDGEGGNVGAEADLHPGEEEVEDGHEDEKTEPGPRAEAGSLRLLLAQLERPRLVTLAGGARVRVSQVEVEEGKAHEHQLATQYGVEGLHCVEIQAGV